MQTRIKRLALSLLVLLAFETNVHAVPTADDASFQTPQATQVNGDLSLLVSDFTDPDFNIGSAPAHGVVTLNLLTGIFFYTPNAGYLGSDLFSLHSGRLPLHAFRYRHDLHQRVPCWYVYTGTSERTRACVSIVAALWSRRASIQIAAKTATSLLNGPSLRTSCERRDVVAWTEIKGFVIASLFRFLADLFASFRNKIPPVV